MHHQKSLRILFVGAGKRASMAEQFIRAGNELGLQVEIFSYERDHRLPIAEFAKVVVGKSFNDPQVEEDIIRVVKEHEIEIIIPFHDAALELSSKLRDEFFVPISNIEKVRIFADKKLTADFLRRNELPTPKQAERAPAIAKPVFGSSSKGLRWFIDEQSLQEFRLSPESEKFEIQELCSGPEVSVDAYISRDRKFSQFAPRLRLEMLGGEAVKSQTIFEPQIDAICKDLCEKANLRGAITIQLIWDDKDKSFKIMEVNLRFGGGVLTTLLAGIPWPEIVLRDYKGLPLKTYPYDQNFLMVRSFREYGFSLSEEEQK